MAFSILGLQNRLELQAVDLLAHHAIVDYIIFLNNICPARCNAELALLLFLLLLKKYPENSVTKVAGVSRVFFIIILELLVRPLCQERLPAWRTVNINEERAPNMMT